MIDLWPWLFAAGFGISFGMLLHAGRESGAEEYMGPAFVLAVLWPVTLCGVLGWWIYGRLK